jgi:hypothetical protein
VNDPLYGPDRSLAFYAAAERKCAASTEATLTVWAAIALALVVAVLVFGGRA